MPQVYRIIKKSMKNVLIILFQLCGTKAGLFEGNLF